MITTPRMSCLETNRLLLRPLSPSDLDYLHGLWTEPLVRRYLWDDQVISRDEAAAVIQASLACIRYVAEPYLSYPS